MTVQLHWPSYPGTASLSPRTVGTDRTLREPSRRQYGGDLREDSPLAGLPHDVLSAPADSRGPAAHRGDGSTNVTLTPWESGNSSGHPSKHLHAGGFPSLYEKWKSGSPGLQGRAFFPLPHLTSGRCLQYVGTSQSKTASPPKSPLDSRRCTCRASSHTVVPRKATAAQELNTISQHGATVISGC